MPSWERLTAFREPFVALVPPAGGGFLLVPPDRVTWSGVGDGRLCASVRFDLAGRPREMEEWELEM